MLRPITVPQDRNFSLHLRLVSRHICGGSGQPALIFWNLVFQYQVIAECIPGQLGDQPVILMQVGAVMAEDQVRIRLILQRFEALLDGTRTVPGRSRHEICARSPCALRARRRKRAGAGSGLRAPALDSNANTTQVTSTRSDPAVPASHRRSQCRYRRSARRSPGSAAAARGAAACLVRCLHDQASPVTSLGRLIGGCSRASRDSCRAPPDDRSRSCP